jgi:zinc transporter ZupT
MDATILGLALVTSVSTIVGGLIAVRLRKFLPYFFAFASGSLIAVTFFDILPESLRMAASASLPTRFVMTIIVGSFLLYSFFERFFMTHHLHDKDNHGHLMGPVGAGSLAVHSFLDGVAIGAAYQVSPSIGLIVAMAVIFHDFTDGINTIVLMLKNNQKLRRALKFLVADAVAPVLGIAVASLVSVNESILAFILSAFCGEFLFIGASHLLPETREHTAWKIILAMLAAAVLIFILTSFI